MGKEAFLFQQGRRMIAFIQRKKRNAAVRAQKSHYNRKGTCPLERMNEFYHFATLENVLLPNGNDSNQPILGSHFAHFSNNHAQTQRSATRRRCSERD
jgi:hypothetical protein